MSFLLFICSKFNLISCCGYFVAVAVVGGSGTGSGGGARVVIVVLAFLCFTFSFIDEHIAMAYLL